MGVKSKIWWQQVGLNLNPKLTIGLGFPCLTIKNHDSGLENCMLLDQKKKLI